MRNGLSVDGRLYAAPFYGESSMLTRRADVMQKAGITLPERLTWAQMKEAADEIADPKAGGCSA